ncbi:putative aspartic protease [Beauveria bassiana ARSEF 2860]|uniref:Putative aspartic protease n=1 Tax=Beauveria bassiana (strain ARSEF 2860) TaxID=655819 RepID=J5JQZ8_BEAB2|nr:putative aspartic protease [Beauveria bassiana ARSEF 2860]EJP67433.1 putative aspartic protease [Beauveria bassiana ARSEF 2860]
MRYTSLSLLVAAEAILASPVERATKPSAVPVKHVVKVSSPNGLIAKGLARINKINGAESTLGNIDASGPAENDDVSYIASVAIGSASWDLIVDTGSSNTWTGAQKSYVPYSTGNDTGGTVGVSYGSGQFSGEEYVDKVTFAGLTVKSQSVGSAKSAVGFNGVDGIFGLGPVGLTRNTVSNAATVPTFLDNLYKQGSIPSEVLGVYFKPEAGSDTSDNNGELTLGGVDSTKYTGALNYVPTLKSGSAAAYWGVSIASFTYGSTVLASGATGIVDTGTTLIYIPSAAYAKYLSASGGKTDANTGLVSYTTKPTANFGIKIGATTYNLTPAQYLVPASQYGFFGLPAGKYYSWIANGGTGSVNTVIGQKFLENYYSVYDTTNARIGFATAA